MVRAILDSAKEVGRRVNDMVATVVLGAIFLVVLTPTALMVRAVRRRQVSGQTVDTYRVPVDPSKTKDLRRQY